jgi:hypothetical protein
MKHSPQHVIEQWNKCHGAFWQLCPGDLEWHMREQDWLSYSVEELAGVPALLARATKKGAEAGIPAANLWVSLYGEIPSGGERAFAEAAESFARGQGAAKMLFGGCEFHLVSGLAKPEADPLLKVLGGQGFQFAEMVDYAGALRTPAIQGYCAKNAGEGWSFTEARDENSLDAVGAFLLKEFPGRWEREFRFWRARADTRRARWYALTREGENQVRGFSRLSIRGKEKGGWCPGALRMPSLTETGRSELDGCLGPIGICATERGKGTGRVLLARTLGELLAIGAQTVCIDWTNAYNYYMPLNLNIVRSYQSAWKQI